MNDSPSLGFATLPPEEARQLVGRHPELGGDGDDVLFVALSSGSKREMAALSDVVSAVRAAFRTHQSSAETVLRTLLPSSRLSLSAGVVQQLHRDAEMRLAVADEFGLLTSADVAERAGSRAENAAALASRWRKEERVFSVTVENSLRFPGFQFDENGRPLSAVPRVIEALGERLSKWELVMWFVAGNTWLGGVRPVDVLGSDEDAVARAAQALAAELV